MALSPRALDHVARPRNRGMMSDADRMGVAGEPGEGPYVQLWLRLKGTRVIEARFETNGCPSSVASASALCELATGREMDRLKLLTPADLVGYLGGLPEGKEMYADLAVMAMRSALEVE